MTARRDVVHPPERQTVKLLSKRLVSAAGGVEAASMATTRSPSQLCAYGLPNAPEFMPVDVAADLEAVTVGQPGHPLLTRHLAKLAGYCLIKRPDAWLSETVWSQRAARLLKEGGDIIAGLGRALETDNDVSPAEAEALVPDADELVTIALEIQAALRDRAAGKF